MPVLSRTGRYGRDDCGYPEQRDRINDYRAVYTPDAVLPYSRDPRDDEPDDCSVCGKATWWDSRTLPNGCLQMRCVGCGSVSTFGL